MCLEDNFEVKGERSWLRDNTKSITGFLLGHNQDLITHAVGPDDEISDTEWLEWSVHGKQCDNYNRKLVQTVKQYCLV